ncbi:hypothetical protein EON65_40570, partial [archaeon]
MALKQVGKVIGTRGDVVKDIQSKSGARIQIDQNFPPQIPRKINISGTVAAVNAAAELVLQAMNSVSKPPQSNNLAPGDGVDYMEVPKPVVGKIIGTRGEHINIIQKRCACDIQVDQSSPSDVPCKVTIKGEYFSLSAHVFHLRHHNSPFTSRNTLKYIPLPYYTHPYLHKHLISMTVLGVPHNIAIAKQLITEVLQGLHISKIGYNSPQPITPGMAAPPNPYMGAMGGYGMPPPNPYMQ